MKHYIRLDVNWGRTLIVPLEEASDFLKVLNNPTYQYVTRYYSQAAGADKDCGDGYLPETHTHHIMIMSEADLRVGIARGNMYIAAEKQRAIADIK